MDEEVGWMDAALCKEYPKLFYPADGERKPTRLLRQRAAYSLCRKCPVWFECLQAGKDEDWGIWAGEDHTYYAR